MVLQHWVDGSHYALIPFDYSGMVTGDARAVETGVPLPDCTVG